MYIDKLKSSFIKIHTVINSCKTIHQCKSCNRLINNYYQCYISEKRANKMIIVAYTQLLRSFLGIKIISLGFKLEIIDEEGKKQDIMVC